MRVWEVSWGFLVWIVICGLWGGIEVCYVCGIILEFFGLFIGWLLWTGGIFRLFELVIYFW